MLLDKNLDSAKTPQDFQPLDAQIRLFTTENEEVQGAGFTKHAIITARLVPPKESWSILVSLLSLYGTRNSLALSALMTFDKANKDALILVLSRRRTPSFPDRRLSSLPTKAQLFKHSVWRLDACQSDEREGLNMGRME